jgi:DNA polymerase III subunit delta'
MKDIVLHDLTRQRAESFTAKPSHALMLTGPTGSGKYTLAVRMAEAILRLPADGFLNHPYGLTIGPEEAGKAIGIEAVRSLEKFTSLKVPGKSAYDRVIVVDGAHLMTLEAQNALLKLLEEPPEGTVIILTVNHEQTMLPTIRSRAQSIPVGRVGRSDLERHFMGREFDDEAIGRAYSISGGLPGLMHALLYESEHPLLLATDYARRLLSQSAYERLSMVDELAKQKMLAIDICAILQHMAHLSLQTASGPVAKRWESILKAAYEAGESLSVSAQPKLVLTKLMLSL